VSRNLTIALIALTLSLSIYRADSVSLLDKGGIRTNTLTTGPRGFYEAYTARNVGDVITVKVVENVDALKNAEINLDNDTNSTAGLILRMTMTATDTLTPDANSVANMVTNFSLPVDYARQKNQTIKVNNTVKFFTLISCLVVEIDPESGNMVVEGSRQILMEGETKSLYVRGIVFPKDIDSNNEIPSYKLANAQIQIIGSGALTKERDSGLLQKIFSRIF